MKYINKRDFEYTYREIFIITNNSKKMQITKDKINSMNKFNPNEKNRKKYEWLIMKWIYEHKWVLSDWTIKKLVKEWIIWLETSNDQIITQEQIFKHINVSTADVTLACDFMIQQSVEWWVIDTQDKTQKVWFKEFSCSKEEWLIVYPWDFILWRTNEIVSLPKFIDCIIIWRSSIARQWLQMEAAWYIDAWFSWTITLEITNFSRFPIKIYPWQRIWQLRFETLDKVVETWYWDKKDSKYQWQIFTTKSELTKDNL